MSATLAIQLIVTFLVGVLFAELVIPALNNHAGKRRAAQREKTIFALVREGWTIYNPDGVQYVENVLDPDETIPFTVVSPVEIRDNNDWLNMGASEQWRQDKEQGKIQ